VAPGEARHRGQQALGLAAAEITADSLDWQSESIYGIVTVLKASLPATMTERDFRDQFDFLSNGLRDASRHETDVAQNLVQEALAAGETPVFDPEADNAITGAQLLSVVDYGTNAAGLTFLYPLAGNQLLITDLALVNVNGQFLRLASYTVLRDQETIPAVRALGRAFAEAVLDAN
jgi:hypothetical protein